MNPDASATIDFVEQALGLQPHSEEERQARKVAARLRGEDDAARLMRSIKVLSKVALHFNIPVVDLMTRPVAEFREMCAVALNDEENRGHVWFLTCAIFQ